MNSASYRSPEFIGLYHEETLRTHRRDLRNRWWFLLLLIIFLVLTVIRPGLHPYAQVVAFIATFVLLYNLWFARILRRGLPPKWFNYLTTTLDLLGLMAYQLIVAYGYAPIQLASSPSQFIFPYILFHVAHRLDYRLLIYALVLSQVCFNLPYILTYHQFRPEELALVPTAGVMGQVIKSLLLLGLGLHFLLIPQDTMTMLERQELNYQARRILTENYQRELEREVENKTQVLTLANRELQKALDDVKTLRGLLPICARCKKIRDEDGQWQSMESFISSRTPASISHGLCRDCLRLLYPDIAEEVLAEADKADDKA